MFSQSCVSLYDPGAGWLSDSDDDVKKVARAWTAPGSLSELDDQISSGGGMRMIIVGNFLPLNSQRDPATGHLSFTWDEDSLLFQMKDGFSSETEVLYVGTLKIDVDKEEEEVVTQMLHDEFNCIPAFLSPTLRKQYYHGFCKHHLWPLFHYMLPISPELGGRFDQSLYIAYTVANQKFAEAITQAMNGTEDYIWIHDYHLMLVPTFLRKRLNRARICFFLHSPFPSSEIYRTFPAREDVLQALLNTDLIGFHTFDYARHFLSCCSRMLGLDYASKRGYIGLEYLGRTVTIKILPAGVNLKRIESALSLTSTVSKLKEIREKYEGKILLLGVDDMDIFKGISLKLLAMELLLKNDAGFCGEVVLIQIVNPPRSTGKDVSDARNEAVSIADRINHDYGSPGYSPVVLIDTPMTYFEKLAFYASADCCIVNAIRDGMNLVPYEYVVCRQGTAEMLEGLDSKIGSWGSSSLVVSEFVGCSPSLSGAIRVNPWDIEVVSAALVDTIRMTDREKKLRHQKHYNYISSHDVNYWAASFEHDLRRACQDHDRRRFWGMGLGLKYRILSLCPSFRRLNITQVVKSYKEARRRAIFLDFDGTIVSKTSVKRSPATPVIGILSSLCSDQNNTVFIVSGRDQASLDEFFSPCTSVGLAAEHGYFTRWNKDSEWESMNLVPSNFGWKEIVEPIMRVYTEATDGSYVESKKTGVVWHHFDAGLEFGTFQSKELMDHLESVLANEPVAVTRGKYIVEVKPQGVGKGQVVEKLLSVLAEDGKHPDFIMCVGDDRSDEDMFESINRVASSPLFLETPNLFACTIGQKPSKAKYYVDDSSEVVSVLKAFVSDEPERCLKRGRSSYDYELHLGGVD